MCEQVAEYNFIIVSCFLHLENACMKRLALLLPVLLAGAFLLSPKRGQAQAPMPQAYPTGQYPAEIRLASAADLQTLYRLNIDIGSLRTASGGVFPAAEEPFEPLIATVYITPEEAQALARAGLTAAPIPNQSQQYGPRQPIDWPDFSQMVARMQTIAGAYPDLARLVSIGKSVQNRDIWCLQITDKPDVDEDEPEVKFSAAIHGDELTGVELTLRMAELLTQSYGQNTYLTSLVDSMEIWLCPISNPDGYVSGNRYNADGVDLNRAFPDRFLDPIDDPAGHEPEVQAFMKFGYAHRFVMGVNYHSGAQVVNYPWDAVTDGGPIPLNPTPSPDDALFHDFSVGYAIRNPYLYNVDFPEGVTRGWEWYQIWGGMQDWAYTWRGEHHVTIELSSDKNPPYNTMDAQWNSNRAAMIWWMSRALTGLRGRVTDAATGAPLDAVVQLQVMNAPNSVRTDPGEGDYHRVIGPGAYTLRASAACYQDATALITVTANMSATVQDFQLVRTDWSVSGAVTEWGSGRPLTATLEIVGAALVTSTNPLDGSYAFPHLCGGNYILRASASGFLTEERQITVDHSQVQNFTLHGNPCSLNWLGNCQPPPSGLYSSTKLASTSGAAPGQVITYTVTLRNTWEAATETLSDTLPAGLTYAGYLTATQGAPAYRDGTISWQGSLSTGGSAAITYTASVKACLAGGTPIANNVLLTDGLGVSITRTATLMVKNAPPSFPQAETPTDGAQDVPSNARLVWQASDPNCDALTYSLAFGGGSAPPIVAEGLAVPSFDPGLLAPNTIYHWYVIVHDKAVSVTGPTWSFTTGVKFKLYLTTVRR